MTMFEAISYNGALCGHRCTTIVGNIERFCVGDFVYDIGGEGRRELAMFVEAVAFSKVQGRYEQSQSNCYMQSGTIKKTTPLPRARDLESCSTPSASLAFPNAMYPSSSTFKYQCFVTIRTITCELEFPNCSMADAQQCQQSRLASSLSSTLCTFPSSKTTVYSQSSSSPSSPTSPHPSP